MALTFEPQLRSGPQVHTLLIKFSLSPLIVFKIYVGNDLVVNTNQVLSYPGFVGTKMASV